MQRKHVTADTRTADRSNGRVDRADPHSRSRDSSNLCRLGCIHRLVHCTATREPCAGKPCLQPTTPSSRPRAPAAVRGQSPLQTQTPMMSVPSSHRCPHPGIPPEMLGAAATPQLRAEVTEIMPAAAARMPRGPWRGSPVRRRQTVPRPHPARHRGSRLPTLRQRPPTPRPAAPRNGGGLRQTVAPPLLSSCAVCPPPTAPTRQQVQPMPLPPLVGPKSCGLLPRPREATPRPRRRSQRAAQQQQ